jgi:hypothetical protein
MRVSVELPEYLLEVCLEHRRSFYANTLTEAEDKVLDIAFVEIGLCVLESLVAGSDGNHAPQTSH